MMMQQDGDMARERREMVAQLELYGIRNARVLDAFRAVRRHLFVDAESRPYAYTDGARDFASSQTFERRLGSLMP